jgi:hypothetical protein
MPQNQPISRFATALCTLALALASTCLRADSFTQTNLVSDVPNLAANADPNLKNPWGVAFSATSPFWASDQATGVATLYGATGTPVSLVVAIPGSASPAQWPYRHGVQQHKRIISCGCHPRDLHLRQP